MSMFDKIKSVEYNTMENYICNYANDEYNDYFMKSENKADIKHILRFWESNKKSLFNLFGQELILTKTYEYEQSKSEMVDNICEKLQNLSFIDNLCKWYNDKFDYYANREERRIVWSLRELITSESLYSNIYCGDTIKLIKPDGKILKIENGCKTSKALGKIAQAFDIADYEEFRIMHSQILNQKKIKGEVCLSIHPLDFMTMSDNECNWDSCMSWINYGEYRQGTVEMMNSPCVVVAYVKASEDMKMICWNNKKWRQLYIVDKNIIKGIRQYPYANENLDLFCLNWLRDLAQANEHFGLYRDEPIETKDCELMEFSDAQRVSFQFSTNLMYCDAEYYGSLAYIGRDAEGTIDINYSGESECMWCGDELDSKFRDNASLICEDCLGREYVQCHLCGYELPKEDSYDINGTILCSCCFDEEGVICTATRCFQLKNECVKFYLDGTDKWVYVLETEIDAIATKYELDVEESKNSELDIYIVKEQDLTHIGKMGFEYHYHRD